MTNPGDGAAGAADRATLDHWRPRLAAIAAAAGQDDAAHDLGHLRRVWDAARAMLQAHPEADALVVLAASYLHDLVNLPKNHPERHLASRQAAAAARERLARAGFPAARLDAVAHAIEAHSFSAGIAPRTIEARIVQDADRLDALGPVGLVRMFHVGGSLGRALAHPSDPLAAQRALDDSRYTLDHIEAKLARLPHGMQTEAGRRLGEQRLAWLRDFRAAFSAQWGGGQLR
ncbi:metal dependent phosphohydrolase [Bordetella pertussis]|uniref:HD domain-containing protein n=38 Tax=Bordetella pertussis TaxID=520 RepID=Q7VV45_BORPE|nr:HD domain-containing protein [Bordetella pertussis]ETH40239.1 HD domain protein [Bordetella pertussis H918]ETH43376.1 HD domain protein [Bordetella pertussis H939]ETH47458.1 HD domain protein [Bordetella pertussis H921]ETH70401.1 HD domain protein [Bordetella pertussis STO1-CHLA-0011]ETH89122.1 HD domain protein [Bordetella pertussis STO1-CHOC-0018]ETH90683.1 HD domain protein [Bordetella pertussis STO1-CHOC-0019]ETI00757.1 HD domain protein [Bordetella pertussis STO1-CHOM-0012]KCV17355.